jgi:hypothetical protein
VPHKDVILDRHAFTDKSVAGNLARFPDTGILLNLDECTDLGFVANLAPIQVDEFRKPDTAPELDIVGYAVE